MIHGAATRALMKGTTLDAVVGMVRCVAPTLKAPLVLFTYFNPILRKGVDNFCRQIKAAGASGARRGEGVGGRAGRMRSKAVGASSMGRKLCATARPQGWTHCPSQLAADPPALARPE